MKLCPSEKLTMLGYTFDDIKAMKARQWRITNYVLLADVALAGFVNLTPCAFKLHWISFAFAVLILILGSRITHRAQRDLQRYRNRVVTIFRHMPEEFQDIWEKLDEDYTKYWKDRLVLTTLYLVQFLGLSLLFLYIIYKS
jgi:hypothetical protein